MSIAIEKLKTEDSEEAHYVIVKAFHDDPFSEWIFADVDMTDQEQVEKLKSWSVSHYIKFRDSIWVARDTDTNKLVGFAFWHEPDSRKSLLTRLYNKAAELYNAWISPKSTESIAEQFSILDKYKTELHKKYFTNPKGTWYLDLLGVDPAYHGKGISRKLLSPVLELADKEGLDAFVESGKEVPNVAIYRKFGFELVSDEDFILVDSQGRKGQIWPMMRRPQ